MISLLDIVLFCKHYPRELLAEHIAETIGATI